MSLNHNYDAEKQKGLSLPLAPGVDEYFLYLIISYLT